MKKYIFSLMAVFATMFTFTSCMTETTSDVVISVVNGVNGVTNVGISSKAISDYADAISKSLKGEKNGNDVILRAQSSHSNAINGAKSAAESVKKQYLSEGIIYNSKMYQLEEAKDFADCDFSISVKSNGFDEEKSILTHYYKVK